MRKHPLLFFVIIMICACRISCISPEPVPPLSVEKNVNLEKYLGTWYEIARLPNSFEKGLVCITATYSIDKSVITVLNRGIREDDRSTPKTARGRAWMPDPAEPGKLKVSFFRPFSSDYWIIDLDTRDYNYALVGLPSRKYLWILGRERTMGKETYEMLIRSAREKGFNTDKLIMVDQTCR